MFIECVMANFTKKDVDKIISYITLPSNPPFKVNRDIEQHRCAVLTKLQNDCILTNIIDAWYNFCESDYYLELVKTKNLINSLSNIISESKNPFTKTELKYIVDYFNNKIYYYNNINTDEQEVKVYLYTEIQKEWLQFYLNQEV